jgi:hypothetical protein
MELIMAVAAQGMEDVSGCTLRVDADKRTRLLNLTQDQDYGALG